MKTEELYLKTENQRLYGLAAWREVKKERDILRAINAELLAALRNLYDLRAYTLNAMRNDQRSFGSTSYHADSFDRARQAIAKAEGLEQNP